MCIQERRQLQWTNDHLHMMVAGRERTGGMRQEKRGKEFYVKYAHRLRMLCALSIVS
jgi:hypothetical protein